MSIMLWGEFGSGWQKREVGVLREAENRKCLPFHVDGDCQSD
ncbi:hypothetical protein [Erwinia mallotivora]|nr:hypothetical protein [Erwinia mallotivora]